MKAKVIVNPMAKKGGAGRSWPEIEQRLRQSIGDFDVSFTTEIGAASGIAREAIGQGYDHLVAVGGDGTVNEVLNGVMANDALINPDTVLCPIPAGTANELCRALGLLDQPEAPYRAIAQGRPRRIDLCKATCPGLDGATRVTYASISIIFGSGAEISHRTSRSRYLKKLGGQFSYYMVTLLVTLTYQAQMLRLTVDDGFDETNLVYTGLCCNTEASGGGMKLAPGALFDDGVLDLVVFGDMKRHEILLKPPSWLFEGHHVEHPKVQVLRGTKFTAQGDPAMLVDADGETIGRLPVTIEVLPAALNVKY